MKVCVVEDDASMRRALRRLLKAANHEVVAFESAEALLKFGPNAKIEGVSVALRPRKAA